MPRPHPAIGSALFTMARLPGQIAQLVNPLGAEADALRRPLVGNLPYPV